MRSVRVCWLLVLCSAIVSGPQLPIAAGEPHEAVRTRLQRDLSYLASDELKGRDVGSAGIDAAQNTIRILPANKIISTSASSGPRKAPAESIA